MTVVGAVLGLGGPANSPFVDAQSSRSGPPASFRLPDESPGLDGIVRTLIAAFDHADVLALGEDHGQRRESDLRIALVRHPDFAKKVRSILVEFGSASQQSTLDRYVRGEEVPIAQLEPVWKSVGWLKNAPVSPIYPDFFAAVREVNSKLAADDRIRVYGGDPGPQGEGKRDAFAVSILKDQALRNGGKALVIYGAAHFYRTSGDVIGLGAGGGIVQRLEVDSPGRTFVVMSVGLPGGSPVAGSLDPDYRKFDRALKTQERPVLVSLLRPPFKDFTMEEFVGRKLLNCRGAGGCVSAFQGSALTLGQVADACVYFGGSVDALAGGSLVPSGSPQM
jgi:hypothetical protein